VQAYLITGTMSVLTSGVFMVGKKKKKRVVGLAQIVLGKSASLCSDTWCNFIIFVVALFYQLGPKYQGYPTH
jgi:hypothetical protein